MAIAGQAFQLGRTARAGFQPIDVAVDRCKGCALCVAVCRPHVLALDESTVNEHGYHPIHLTNPAECTSCALCARICPDVVFTVYARPKGRPA
jgi:2-oxoglutarate ferredoxin oxidoreductase subunit delta